MVRKLSFAFCALVIAGQVAMAQNSAGNILTGDVKADVVKRYGGSGALPKPDKLLIRDFAVPAGDITIDESPAAQLHRRIMLRHGVDEDSSPEVLAQQIQAVFAKTLASELQQLNIPTQRASAGGASAGDPHGTGPQAGSRQTARPESPPANRVKSEAASSRDVGQPVKWIVFRLADKPGADRISQQTWAFVGTDPRPTVQFRLACDREEPVDSPRLSSRNRTSGSDNFRIFHSEVSLH